MAAISYVLNFPLVRPTRRITDPQKKGSRLQHCTHLPVTYISESAYLFDICVRANLLMSIPDFATKKMDICSRRRGLPLQHTRSKKTDKQKLRNATLHSSLYGLASLCH